MSKEIAVRNSELALDFTDKELLETLKETVAKGTTDAEFKMFLEICKSSGLNPFRKEIWCVVIPEKPASGNYRGRRREVQMMTGINGFYEIANSEPSYDGRQSGLIAPDGSRVPLEYQKDDFIGAWTEVYRKDRKFPQSEVAFMNEYAKDTWPKQRRVMISKCADALAFRKAFPQKLNGLYAAEEMPAEYSAEVVTTKLEAVIDKKPDVSQAQVLDKKELKANNEVAEQVFGDDNISLTTAESYVYNLAPKFKDVDAKKYNERFDWCKSQGGKPLGNHVWAFDKAVKVFTEYQIESDELVEQGRAA